VLVKPILEVSSVYAFMILRFRELTGD
jgi:hypothetical protein